MSKTYNSPRIPYIDTAKALCIALVVIGHVLIAVNPDYSIKPVTALQEFIYAFHMPAFFIINGVLFNEKKYNAMPFVTFIKSRLYTLAVPYFFFEILGIVTRFILYNQPIKTGIYNMLTIRCNVGADWFLPALFMGNILVFIYIKAKNIETSDEVIGTCISIVTAVLALLIPFYLYRNVLSAGRFGKELLQLTVVFNRACVAFGFIIIGCLLRPLILHYRQIKKEDFWPTVFLGVMALVPTAAAAVINIKLVGNDIFAGAIGNPVTLIFGGISGTVAVLVIARLAGYGCVATVGRHTLTIMGTHQIVLYALLVLIPSVAGNVAMGILLLAIIVLVEIPVVYLIDKYIPFLVGRKK